MTEAGCRKDRLSILLDLEGMVHFTRADKATRALEVDKNYISPQEESHRNNPLQYETTSYQKRK
jgi:hypothetical protein